MMTYKYKHYQALMKQDDVLQIQTLFETANSAMSQSNVCQIKPACLSSVLTPLAIYPFSVLNGFTALSHFFAT